MVRTTIEAGGNEFEPTDDDVNGQVECVNCGFVTSTKAYGVDPGEHECYEDRATGEDAGFPGGAL